ncbi:MAG: hypothetical protein V4727_02005 [Verrucomicrobiota bacterium]
MNTDIYSEPPENHFPRDADDTATVMAEEAMGATKDKVQRAADSAKEMYHTAAVKAEETLEISKDYVRRNPVTVVLGAVAFGAALGYLLQASMRKQTFSERCANEPMSAVRDAILGALSPVTQRVHNGYDMARDGAGKAMDRLHRIGSRHAGNSFSDRVGRISNNLKFW